MTVSIERIDLLVGTLAGRADIPIGADTQGWEWLIELRDRVMEDLSESPVEPLHDVLHLAVRATLPDSRTEHIWQVFVDVEGWLVEAHQYVTPELEDGGITVVAKEVLYVIARRYAEAVAEAFQRARYTEAEPIWLGPVKAWHDTSEDE